MPQSILSSLGQLIATNAEVLEQYYQQLGSQQSSEDNPYPELPNDAPNRVIEAREFIVGASARISQILEGPRPIFENVRRQAQTINVLRWLYHYKIHLYVPESGKAISMKEVSELAKVPLHQLRSNTRMAMTAGYFTEPEPEHLAHSMASMLVVKDPDQDGQACFTLESVVPATGGLIEATQLFGDTNMNNEAAYNAAFKTDKPFFKHLFEDKERAQNFAGFSRALSKVGNRDPRYLVEGFDWTPFSTVIDVSTPGRRFLSEQIRTKTADS